MTENREYWLKYKKENPIAAKLRFIRDFIFRDFRSYANSQLNCCGWLFEEGSYNHKLWKLYHCDLEEIERLHGYRISVYQKNHSRFDFKITPELKQIFLTYLHDVHILYKKTLELHQPNRGQYEFYLSWFEKNIRKFEKMSQ